ncbi:FKBP2 protein, partial [Pseudoatta argentina]
MLSFWGKVICFSIVNTNKIHEYCGETSHPTNVVIHITALILQPGNKYSQYVNESFRITMASLDLTHATYMKSGQILEEFDRFENLGFRFKLGAGFVIKGLDVAVIGMKIDEKRRLIIPPNMAYGDEGYGLKVPPNTTVIYDVELKKVE